MQSWPNCNEHFRKIWLDGLLVTAQCGGVRNGLIHNVPKVVVCSDKGKFGGLRAYRVLVCALFVWSGGYRGINGQHNLGVEVPVRESKWYFSRLLRLYSDIAVSILWNLVAHIFRSMLRPVATEFWWHVHLCKITVPTNRKMYKFGPKWDVKSPMARKKHSLVVMHWQVGHYVP